MVARNIHRAGTYRSGTVRPDMCRKLVAGRCGLRKSPIASSAGSSFYIARRNVCACLHSSPRTPSYARSPRTRIQISALLNLLFRIHICLTCNFAEALDSLLHQYKTAHFTAKMFGKNLALGLKHKKDAPANVAEGLEIALALGNNQAGILE